MSEGTGGSRARVEGGGRQDVIMSSPVALALRPAKTRRRSHFFQIFLFSVPYFIEENT